MLQLFAITLQEFYKNDGKPMWYKNGQQVGIKCEFGANKGKQVITFGGKTCGKSKDDLMELGEQCIKKLNDGMELAEALAWVKDQAKQ